MTIDDKQSFRRHLKNQRNHYKNNSDALIKMPGIRLSVVCGILFCLSVVVSIYLIVYCILSFIDLDFINHNSWLIEIIALSLGVFFSIPLFSGMRFALIECIEDGTIDLRNIFILFKSDHLFSKLAGVAMCFARAVVFSFFISFWSFSDAIIHIPPFIVMIVGLTISLVWMRITWWVPLVPLLGNYNLHLSDLIKMIKGGKCNIICGTYRGLIYTYIPRLLLTVLTLFILAVADVLPSLFIAKAMCSKRIIDYLTTERNLTNNE